MTRELLQARIRNWLLRRTANSAVRRVGDLPIALGTDIGTVRAENQDRVAVLRSQISGRRFCTIVALADGMGGMRAGAECASLAISSFFSSCICNTDDELDARIKKAAHDSNDAVYSLFHGEGGATLSAMLYDSDKGLSYLNVGDSRIYGFEEGSIQQLTTDDTIAARFQKEGESSNHYRNELLQFIGAGDGLEPHVVKLSPVSEQYLITSDGLHFVDKVILQMITNHAGDPGLAAKRLTEVAKWCGGHDNGSVVVITADAFRNDVGDAYDPELIFVWDPYGDLQLVKMDSLRSKEASPDLASYSPSFERPSDEKQNRQKRRPKFTKKQQKEPVGATMPQPTDVAERPQLKIDFVDEADKSNDT